MRDNTAFDWSPGLIRRTEPKKSKIFQLFIVRPTTSPDQTEQNISTDGACADFGFFQSRPIRYLFSGVEIGLNGSYWIDLIAYK
jgi:hypothetical protein